MGLVFVPKNVNRDFSQIHRLELVIQLAHNIRCSLQMTELTNAYQNAVALFLFLYMLLHKIEHVSLHAQISAI